jgi:hypothetical protein
VPRGSGITTRADGTDIEVTVSSNEVVLVTLRDSSGTPRELRE